MRGWEEGLNVHMLVVKLHDLVYEGHLVRNVAVVQEVLPTLSLLKVPDFSCGQLNTEISESRRMYIFYM